MINNKMKTTMAMCLAIMMFFYIMWSFIYVDLNPSFWTFEARMIYTFVSTIAMGGVILFRHAEM